MVKEINYYFETDIWEQIKHLENSNSILIKAIYSFKCSGFQMGLQSNTLFGSRITMKCRLQTLLGHLFFSCANDSCTLPPNFIAAIESEDK
jgi:hypothetical protein